MKLTLVISSLERGGAERILSVLASAWANKGREVTLITFDDKEPPAYPLHPDIALRSLSVPNEPTKIVHVVPRNLRRVRLLRYLIRQLRPDLVVSFLDFPNIITLLATRGLGVPVIVSERANPELVELKPVWKRLRRSLYPSAAALVCQTNAMVAQLQQTIKVAGYAIPNPVELPATWNANAPKGGNNDSRTIIAMGRLVQQKGFDLLLDAFSRIAARHSEWSLKVLGQGCLKDQLEAQADSLGLKDRVRFLGAFADPFPVLRSADLFVFSSRFEGFGNALTEAMACGLPAVSFDCPAGPADIIRHGVDGLLVPLQDVPALAEAMDYLMSDGDAREKLASRAPDVLQRFSLEKVLAMWEKVFADVLPAPDVRGKN